MIAIGTDEEGRVLVRVSDPGGVRVTYLVPEVAVQVGERMAALGRKSLLRPATKRLIVAATNGGKHAG